MAAGSLLAALVLPAAMSLKNVFAAADRCSADGGGGTAAADGPAAVPVGSADASTDRRTLSAPDDLRRTDEFAGAQ